NPSLVIESNENNNTGTFEINLASPYGTSYYLYATVPCTSTPPPNCNPSYPNTTAICTPGGGYTCTSSQGGGVSYYLYASVPCSSPAPPNCNPSYPNTTAICTPGGGYTCTSTSGYNCLPGDPTCYGGYGYPPPPYNPAPYNPSPYGAGGGVSALP